MIPLKINGVKKTYDGDVYALKGMDFSLVEGEIFGLLGPNGSGKTTLISIICSLLEATEGSVEVFGEEVSTKNLNVKRLLGIVPQEIISHGFFTVDEILNFISGYYGISDNQKHIDYLLENLGLSEHRNKKVAQLSGGMKRRLLIAKALVHKPKLLLLDEPTAGVDIELRNSLWAFVKELNQQGCTILLTTHYLEEAENLCQRIGIINYGELLRIGNTKDIIREFTNREVTIELKEQERKLESEYLLKTKDTKHIFQLPSNMDIGALLQHLSLDLNSIQDLQMRDGKLEDAFLRVLGDSRNEL